MRGIAVLEIDTFRCSSSDNWYTNTLSHCQGTDWLRTQSKDLLGMLHTLPQHHGCNSYMGQLAWLYLFQGEHSSGATNHVPNTSFSTQQ